MPIGANGAAARSEFVPGRVLGPCGPRLSPTIMLMRMFIGARGVRSAHAFASWFRIAATPQLDQGRAQRGGGGDCSIPPLIPGLIRSFAQPMQQIEQIAGPKPHLASLHDGAKARREPQGDVRAEIIGPPRQLDELVLVEHGDVFGHRIQVEWLGRGSERLCEISGPFLDGQG